MITLANRLNARLIIRGLYVYDDQLNLVLTARLIDAHTGKTLEFVETRGPESEIFNMGAAIADKAVAWAQALLGE